MVGVLIAVGITGVLAMVVLSLLQSQTTELRAISEKLAANDVHSILSAALSNGNVCKFILNRPSRAPLTFNSTAVANSPQSLNVDEIYASISETGTPGPLVAKVGEAPSSYTDHLVVEAIKLSIDSAPSPLTPPGPNVTFKGTWMISYVAQKLARAIKPTTIPVLVYADTTNPNQTKITGCQFTGNNGIFSLGYEMVSQNCATGDASCAVLCPPGKVAIGGGGLAAERFSSNSSGAYLSASTAGRPLTAREVSNLLLRTGSGRGSHRSRVPPFVASNEGWIVTGSGWKSTGVMVQADITQKDDATLSVWAICVNK